jgi:uncharacterized iron-regulated membrane protein
VEVFGSFAMLLLRLIGILTAITIGSAVVAWLFTRDRRYLSLAWRVSKGAIITALAIFALLFAERLLVMV